MPAPEEQRAERAANQRRKERRAEVLQIAAVLVAPAIQNELRMGVMGANDEMLKRLFDECFGIALQMVKRADGIYGVQHDTE